MTGDAETAMVLRQALFIFGLCPDVSVQPGSFITALFECIVRADPVNQVRLAGSFPTHVWAVQTLQSEGGVTELLDTIKQLEEA